MIKMIVHLKCILNTFNMTFHQIISARKSVSKYMFCRVTLEIFNMGVAWARTNQDRCPNNKWEQEDISARHMSS